MIYYLFHVHYQDGSEKKTWCSSTDEALELSNNFENDDDVYHIELIEVDDYKPAYERP